MFLATSFNHPEYTSRRRRRASSSVLSYEYEFARLPCVMSMAYSDAPRRRFIGISASLTVNASSWCPASDKPFPSCVIAVHPKGVMSPAAPRTSSSTPTRARTARRRGSLVRTGCTCPPFPPLRHAFSLQIVLLGLGDQNLRLLRQARHVRKARRPAARTHAHEALLRFPMEGLRADVARLALRVPRARLRRDRYGRRVLLIRIVLLGAASFLIFLQSLSCPPSFQCCSWHAGPQ